MRTVPGATVSGVTSLRLLRQHLWRHTGSSLPLQIRAAALWLSVFRACSTAPRGGPRTEPPRPSGCWPTTSSLYLRGRGSSTSSSSPHSQLPEHFEPLPFALLSPPFVAKVPPSDEVHEEVPPSSAPPRFRRSFLTASVSSAASATPSSSPSLFIFAASPAIIAFYTFRLRLASISPHSLPFVFQFLGR